MTPRQASLVRAAGLPSIAVNDTFRLAPWADMLYGADAAWWRHNAQEALRFDGLKVTAQDSCEFGAVHLLRNTGSHGFEPEPSGIRTGGNSGYQAIHVAIHAGASRILLLGFDMRGGHWHGQHPEPLTNPGPAEFERWIDRFDALNGRGSEIINCTPGSALECFPMQDLGEVIA